MTNREDGVSEVIGGVLLIALVLIGATIVGTYVASQPLPERVPKVQFNIKEIDNTIYLEHEGGESLNRGDFSIVVDGSTINDSEWMIQPDGAGPWTLGKKIVISGHPGAQSIGLVFKGGSGETLLRAPNSPWGFDIVFPSFDPNEIIDIPAPFAGQDSYGDLEWQFPETGDPQPLFPPLNTKHVYVAPKGWIPNPEKPLPEPPLFICDGVNDEQEINDAIAIAEGGIVELLDGTFRCSGRITMREHTTLWGQGSLSTTIETKANGGSGYLPIAVSAEYVNLGGRDGDDMKGFTIRGNAFVMVTRSHVRVHDIRATCVDLDGVWHEASGNGMFFVWVAPPVKVIDDVEFWECHVVNSHTHGFNMNQDYSDGIPRATTNIRFVNCRAVRCGFGRVGDPGVVTGNQSRSEWITGFDFHEWQDLINLEVVNCIAEDNWESGFHLEPGARYGSNGENIGPRTVSKNIRFRDCFSSNNGQRNTYTGHFFMSGYYLSRDTRLTNCQSMHNRNSGYYVHSGANSSFVGCSDDGSTYGWKICKASSDITLTDCTSRNNLRWALWISFSQRVNVRDFNQYFVNGDRGYQNILGWYKDEAKYQQPVTDSVFEITAYGSRLPIINRAGSNNEYYLSFG
ncbi:MAG TPA: type IV pilin N-terminal domain-containing protein [Methanoregulaceae archaeon]|nr:type IV pilin N-terminal domain-containing protein [Methanoregulaceae archaeon]